MADLPLGGAPGEAQTLTPRCSGCHGPYQFDTTIPSPTWNHVVRDAGYPEYLCANCILRIFARSGISFSATLWGAEFSGTPIEVRIRGQVAKDATALSDENTQLRAERHESAQRIASLEAERDEAREWVRKMHRDSQVLTCVYCGHAYPPGTPSSGANVLTEHIRMCDKHPMRALEAQLTALEAETARLLNALRHDPVSDPGDCPCLYCSETRLRTQLTALTEAHARQRRQDVEAFMRIWDEWRSAIPLERGFSHSDGLKFVRAVEAYLASETP